MITLIVENSRLREQLRSASPDTNFPNENPKSIASLLKMVLAMAIDCYGYQPEAQKSPVPKQLSDVVTEKLGENIDPDTTRRWLRVAANQFSSPVKKE